MENKQYPISEIASYIVGGYSASNYFSFVIYTDKAPAEGDIIDIEGKLYEVDSVVDDTNDEEYEQGLSYSRVTMIEVERW